MQRMIEITMERIIYVQNVRFKVQKKEKKSKDDEKYNEKLSYYKNIIREHTFANIKHSKLKYR
jgi:3-phosphoglycerate kinase